MLKKKTTRLIASLKKHNKTNLYTLSKGRKVAADNIRSSRKLSGPKQVRKEFRQTYC